VSVQGARSDQADINPGTAVAPAAAVALFRFKAGVIPLLAACASAGLLVTFALPLVR
jgi:hypothetical protein